MIYACGVWGTGDARVDVGIVPYRRGTGGCAGGASPSPTVIQHRAAFGYSLRLGHGAGLTAHRAVIQHRTAAFGYPMGEGLRETSPRP